MVIFHSYVNVYQRVIQIHLISKMDLNACCAGFPMISQHVRGLEAANISLPKDQFHVDLRIHCKRT